MKQFLCLIGLMFCLELNINQHVFIDSKCLLINEVQGYINKIAPSSTLDALKIIDLCEKYKIDLCFVLAQAELESHFGTKGVASKTNSIWNVGAFDNQKPILSYTHQNHSIEPYLKLLNNNYLYNKNIEDLFINFSDKYNRRYASNPKYEKHLKFKYLKIKNTTKIDSLQKTISIWLY